jgi:hypothetical protein
MRPAPASRVILSDDEIAANLRKSGKSATAVRDALSDRAVIRSKAQAEYDEDRILSPNDRHVREQGAALREQARRQTAEADSV